MMRKFSAQADGWISIVPKALQPGTVRYFSGGQEARVSWHGEIWQAVDTTDPDSRDEGPIYGLYIWL